MPGSHPDKRGLRPKRVGKGSEFLIALKDPEQGALPARIEAAQEGTRTCRCAGLSRDEHLLAMELVKLGRIGRNWTI